MAYAEQLDDHSSPPLSFRDEGWCSEGGLDPKSCESLSGGGVLGNL